MFEEKQREVADCNHREQEEQQQQPVLESVKERRQKKRGQPSIVSKFPEIVGRMTDFLKQHGYAAHNRRRTTTGTGQGVTLGQIKQHLLSTVEGLAEHGISRDTIHLMMAPPRKGTKREGRYKGLVDARVPAKKNQYREDHPNTHFLFSRVAYRREMGVVFSDEIETFSVDDMNKIKVGPNAVGRYHQISNFFLRDDSPNYPDHDFPHPGYLIIPSGYMRLCHSPAEGSEFEEIAGNEDSCSDASEAEDDEQMGNDGETDNNQPDLVPDSTTVVEDRGQSLFKIIPSEGINKMSAQHDKVGRVHLKLPHTGPAVVNLRASAFYSSTVQSHMNDMWPILETSVEKGKTAAIIVADNSPDGS